MNNLEKFRRVKAFVFDVDGVLTDHSIFVFENGKIVRKLNNKDLIALRKAVENKYKIAIISGGSLSELTPIFKEIGITDIYEKTRDKKAAYDEFKTIYGIDNEQVLYMGDDLPDYPVMRIVGLPVCPKNAAPEIREITRYISPLGGGEGCVRDVIEKVLRLKKVWLPKESK
ncbi:MAG: KdsC family phosphatase [Saprospiraceae bacterium]